jgi:hypothetical protein
MKVSKTAILPIITVICLGVSSITGHKVDESLQGQIADWAASLIGVGIGVWGVIKNHKGEGK